MNKKMNTGDKSHQIGRIDFKIYKRFEKRWQRIVLKILHNINQNWKLIFLQKYGTVRDAWSVFNTITSAGKAAEAGLVGNVGGITAFGYLALGLSTTAPDVSQTALISEIVDSGLARHAATVTRITTSVTNDTLQFTYTWTASGAKTVEEIGIFNASSSGIMLGRALTTSKAVANGETLAATYTVQYT